MVQQVEVPKVEFITRVAKLPVVSSAIEYATDTYGKAKESSPNLIQRTLSTAEDTVKYAAKRALPVVHTFERPIHAVDSLVCKTLDKVEENIPMMKKTPDEIMTTTRSYVNEKWQPVHNQVESAYGVVSSVTNTLIDNPVTRFALNSMESTVSMCHNYLDYYLPPVPGESPKEPIPEEPSQKLMWAARRSWELVTKTQHRVLLRAQQNLRKLGTSGMFYTGALFEIFLWSIDSSKNALMNLPNKLREMVNYYRDKSGNPQPNQPTSAVDDAIFLAKTLAGRVMDVIRQGLRMTALPPGDILETLRYRLGQILQPTADFASSLVRAATPGDLADRAQEFLKGNFMMLYKAFKYVKDGAAYQLGLMKLKDERALQIEEEATKQYRTQKRTEAEQQGSEQRESGEQREDEQQQQPESEPEEQEPSNVSDIGVMSDTSLQSIH